MKLRGSGCFPEHIRGPSEAALMLNPEGMGFTAIGRDNSFHSPFITKSYWWLPFAGLGTATNARSVISLAPQTIQRVLDEGGNGTSER